MGESINWVTMTHLSPPQGNVVGLGVASQNLGLWSGWATEIFGMFGIISASIIKGDFAATYMVNNTPVYSS